MRSRSRYVAAFMAIAPTAWGAPPEDSWEKLSSSALVQEVVAETTHPHAYDYRATPYELSLGLVNSYEANNFQNGRFDYELLLGVPTRSGQLIRMGLRRIEVLSTHSSDLVGRTPFKQYSTQSRYELLGQWGYPLLEALSISRLSFLPNLQSVTWGLIGAHYSHINRGWIPKAKDRDKPLPGQDPVNAKLVFELGLVSQLYFPQSFGIYWEALFNKPVMGNTEKLGHWFYLVIGAVWTGS